LPQHDAGVLRERIRNHYDRHETLHRTEGGVAVIEVEGTLVDKGAYLGQSSGETSYEGLSIQVADALADDSIKGVVFEIDSPGGLVSGAFELAEEIFALSQAKPTIAILTPNACSAAYLLSGGCRAIVLPETGYAGSIGVISAHVNATKAAEKAGYEFTLFGAGIKKGDGHPFVEPRDGYFEERRAESEALRELFAETVARYRSHAIDKDAILATEAGLYRGQAAVDVGLADAVAPPKEAFAAFVKQYG